MLPCRPHYRGSPSQHERLCRSIRVLSVIRGPIHRIFHLQFRDLLEMKPGFQSAIRIAAAVIFAASWACAGEPNLRDLNLRGLKIGEKTTIVCSGDDFCVTPGLLLPFPAQVELKPGATGTQATFDVTLSKDVVPGYYHLRLLTEAGISAPTLIAVDRLAQQSMGPVATALPVALSGAIGGSSIAETTFEGQAGESVLVEVEAQRLGSKLRPIIHVYNARRRQLHWAWATPSLNGDSRLEVTLPESGKYTVAVHDAEYAVPGPGFFRLKIGRWSFVDQVFPPVVGPSQAVELALLGSIPSPTLDYVAPSSAGACPLAWPAGELWSGPRPVVRISSRAELVELPSSATPQELPAGAVAVSGRLLAPFEEDRYRVGVTPKTKIRLAVFADRLGAPLDAALIIRNERGDVLSRADESPGTVDPVLEFAVPDGVTAIVVGVADTQGRGGPSGVYRLTVDPPDAPTDPAPFRLSTTVQRITVPAGGRSVVPVLIDRRGFAGGIDLLPAGLGEGYRVTNATIPEGSEGALVALERGGAPVAAAVTTWRGRTSQSVERLMVVDGHPLERLQPWLAEEIAVAPSNASAASFAVDWRDLPEDAALFPASKLALPVKVVRPTSPGDTSVVRLTLATSQGPRQINNQPDVARVLRQEAPVQLAAAALEGAVNVLAPADLAAPVYDVAIQAELVTADNKTVLAKAWTPVRRLPVRPPVELSLDGPPRIEAGVDSAKGATIPISGTIERRGGFAGPLTVSLTGLPAGATGGTVTVKADAKVFTVNLVLPANTPPGEIKTLKLSANVVPDQNRPDIRFRSRELDLSLVVKVQAAK